MPRKITDVDAIFLGDDPVDRMFIGNTLVWNGDNVPELEASEEVYFDVTGYTPTTLANLGTSTDDFDLPATGASVAGVTAWPGLLPGDYAYSYQGEIDTSVVGASPMSYERLVTDYPYLYKSNIISNVFAITNTGTEGASGQINAEASNVFSTIRNFYFPGLTNNYLFVPDAANLDLTTGVEITFRVMIMEPDNRLGNQRIVAKSGTSRGYEVFIGYDSAHATLNFTPNAVQSATTSVKLGILPEHPYWFRVTYDQASAQTKFYIAPNASTEPSTWTQIGNTITTVNALMVANTDTLKIGTYNGSGDLFKGRLCNLIIRNAATAGTTVLNIDIAADTTSMVQDSTTFFTATSGQTVGVTKSGTPPNTCRLVPEFSWTLTTGNRFGYGTLFDQLLTVPNQLQVIWFRASINTDGTYDTTRRVIYPVIRDGLDANGPAPYYVPGSWGLYFDSFNSQIHWTYRGASTDSFSESFNFGAGVGVGTGDQVYGVALLTWDGQTTAWGPFRYTPSTHTFTYPSNGGSGNAPAVTLSGETGMISSTSNTLQLWTGRGGFTMKTVGIANYPNFAMDDDNVGWTGGSYDIRLKDFIEDRLRIMVLDEAPTYTVGEYWRASVDGTMEGAPEGVEEGDLLAVKSASPLQWQQIKLNHPYRRKTLRRPRHTTFGYTANPVTVLDTEDFFIWAVNSVYFEENTDEYVTYSYNNTTTDAWMDMEVWASDVEQNFYAEIDMDDGRGGWTQLSDENDPTTFPRIWQNGHSSPTLFAMGVDRANATFYSWIYDAENGYRRYDNEGSEPMDDSITFDQMDFFGPDLGEGYNHAIYWGGGWRKGVGIIPSEADIQELWERTVYGYPLS